MLVLSRRVREEIHLFHDGQIMAKIVLVSSAENKARIGVEAPPEVKIVRQEISNTPKQEGVMTD